LPGAPELAGPASSIDFQGAPFKKGLVERLDFSLVQQLAILKGGASSFACAWMGAIALGFHCCDGKRLSRSSFNFEGKRLVFCLSSDGGA
jgi:hypothetical protein